MFFAALLRGILGFLCFQFMIKKTVIRVETEVTLNEEQPKFNVIKAMDKTRLTTMASVSMCPVDAKYVQIPDTVSWNHYFGWYGGDTTMNGSWFDDFHAKYPNLPVGFTVIRLTSLMGAANVSFTKEQPLALNAQLNQIKK